MTTFRTIKYLSMDDGRSTYAVLTYCANPDPVKIPNVGKWSRGYVSAAFCLSLWSELLRSPEVRTSGLPLSKRTLHPRTHASLRVAAASHPRSVQLAASSRGSSLMLAHAHSSCRHHDATLCMLSCYLFNLPTPRRPLSPHAVPHAAMPPPHGPIALQSSDTKAAARLSECLSGVGRARGLDGPTYRRHLRSEDLPAMRGRAGRPI